MKESAVKEIHFQQWFDEAPAALFERFMRHERLAEIYPAKFQRVQDADQGDPDGAGSIREINANGLRFCEQGTFCEVPARIHYRIVCCRKLISHHRGYMAFSPVAGGTLLDYRMELAFRLPLDAIWAALMKRMVQGRMRRLAARIKQQESS